jgi:hypothetical protein
MTGNRGCEVHRVRMDLLLMMGHAVHKDPKEQTMDPKDSKATSVVF